MEKEKLLNLDLQFFAEKKEEVVEEEDYEVEIVDEEEEDEEEKKEKTDEKETEEPESNDEEEKESDVEDSDESEEANEEEEESEEEEGKDEEEGTEKKVPLSALKAEREKWKSRLEAEKEMADIGRKLLEGTGRSLEELKLDLDNMEIKKMTDKGISEEEAKKSIEAKRKLSKEQMKIRKEKQELEFEKLKVDKFYSDIDNYKEDIESLVESKNLSIKEAYMLIAGEKKLQEKEYQSQFAKPKKKAPKKVKTVSKGEATPQKTKIKLTSAEAYIAKMAGMTPKQYWDSKNRHKN